MTSYKVSCSDFYNGSNPISNRSSSLNLLRCDSTVNSSSTTLSGRRGSHYYQYGNFDGNSTAINGLLTAIGATGTLLNLFVIFVIASHRPLRKRLQNYFIVNRCVVDLFIGIVLVFTSGLMMPNRTPTSRAAFYLQCFFVRNSFLLLAMFSISIWNLAALSIERYAEIVYPISHKMYLTKSKVFWIIVSLWIFGTGVVVATRMSITRVYQNSCNYKVYWNTAGRLFSGIIMILVDFFIPLIAIAFCYIQMVRVTRRVQTAPIVVPNSYFVKSGRSLIRVMIIVTILFVTTVGPRHVIFLAASAGYKVDFDGTPNQISVVINALICCINPLVYSIYYHEFRRGICVMFNRLSSPASGSIAIAIVDVS
jgi:hypothetical protein